MAGREVFCEDSTHDAVGNDVPAAHAPLNCTLDAAMPHPAKPQRSVSAASLFFTGQSDRLDKARRRGGTRTDSIPAEACRGEHESATRKARSNRSIAM
jgi:hypothetical protein